MSVFQEILKEKENKKANGWHDMVNYPIHTDKFGWVTIKEFKEEESWGGKVNIYLDKFHINNCIGSFQSFAGVTGGALLVEQIEYEG